MIWLRRTVAGLCLLGVGACSPVFRNHGYAPDETELSAIVVGESTREDVADAVGRPTAAALLDDDGWYYVQSRYRLYGARRPQEIDRQVVSISFAEDDTVANVERFGLENGRVVPLSRRVTESNIRGIGLIQQLLGNLGRVDAGSLLGGGPQGPAGGGF